jgi:glutathione synthase/RimK-type ligase-like ATP-grasp enzyme
VNDIQCLVVSSTIDYSTDLICYELEMQGIRYLRINRDRFSQYKITYSLEESCMQITLNNRLYMIKENSLKSIYFRAPVFLRTSKSYSLEEQLYRGQWSAFIRNLIIFEKAKWVNHPVKVYQAENKLYQLKLAKKNKLDIPKTFMGNMIPKEINLERPYIVKSLDTALFYEKDKEMFTYANILSGEELLNSEIQYAPIIIQECLENKTDIRVTVIGTELFAVSILEDGEQIKGDWRRTTTEDLEYKKILLPTSVETKITKLMGELGLEFGGVDLALVDGKYYFIEVNPTGEWGWLVSSTDLPIDKAIAENLVIGDSYE